MRGYISALVLAGACLAIASSAQNVPVVVAHPLTVGAITRDAGVYSAWNGGHDLAIMRKVNGALINLESDLAGKISSMPGISYQDRSATGALLQEVHMTTGRDFDQSTGALRGLMGRLDFLIVIDAVDASTARMRLIEVQTGSVKGVESCHAGANAVCVNQMAAKLKAAGQEVAGANGALLAQRSEVMAAKPEWDDQVARYEADKELWERRQSTISAAGHALRPEIRVLLNGAQKDVETGRYAVQTLDTQALKTATATLTEKLDKLEQY
jgi:hypothetical protein